ncbi:MAG: Methionine synthase [Alphaproteobacteria bacterium MarineAlpha2_Bin1]|nr:MAG: Methionine synthase [Alphaproteobacteria bacterium MarineAlpha2_Bin1]
MFHQDRINNLISSLKKRILIIDGAMGTMIQKKDLSESDFRSSKFENWSIDLKGNGDVLNITNSEIINSIHSAFLDAGADIILTNTFNSNKISQSDYGLEDYSTEMNFSAAKLARSVADKFTDKNPDKIRFVAGAIGPTNKTASISPKVDDPAYRNVSFDELKDVYKESAISLIDGGVDFLILETIFDTLNAKAGIFAVGEINQKRSHKVPLMISGTITDFSGRNLSGQTVEAFWNSVRHAEPLSIGLNCSFGAERLTPAVEELSRVADTNILAYPNAGLPNPMGEYDETPDTTASYIAEWAKNGIINIVGGCCGTTPEHIKKIYEQVSLYSPRVIPKIEKTIKLSGLEPFGVIS